MSSSWAERVACFQPLLPGKLQEIELVPALMLLEALTLLHRHRLAEAMCDQGSGSS